MPPAERATLWTAPNAITALRVLLIPPFAAYAIAGQDMAALAIFAAAGLSDVLDGALARRWGQSSKWGRLLDPFADKLLTGTAFVVLALFRPAPPAMPLWVMAAVVGRDAAILAGSALVYGAKRNSGFKPSLAGKLNTLIEIGVVVWFLAAARFAGLAPVLPLLYAALLISLVVSLADYTRAGFRMLRA
jgi:cardiolipin synthase